jgi:glycosyltransferase involved in cell wall biosynthesis
MMKPVSLKSILCISHVFPPVPLTGAHRTRAVVRHLPAYGWRPVVVTVRPELDTPTDPSLLQGLPKDLVIYRTPAPQLLTLLTDWLSGIRRLRRRLRSARAAETQNQDNGSTTAGTDSAGFLDGLTWCLKIPDLSIGWIPWGLFAALRAVTRHKCRAIYSSAPPWTAHLIGLLAKRYTRLPWIADFRDPWRANPFHRVPYRLLDRFDARLERSVVREADWVICNSESVRRNFMTRFPDRADRFITIPNGYDPEDFADLQPRRLVGPDRLVLTHAGGFYGRRRPDSIFRAIRLLLDRAVLDDQICLQLVGHDRYEGKPLAAMAADHGVADHLLLPGEVPHRQALELMRGSDIQLLVGFGGAGGDLQVPAKLYEYMGVGRPVLALAPRQSAIAEVMASLGSLGAVCDPDDAEQIAAAIQALAARCQPAPFTAPVTANGHSNGTPTHYHRREQVGRLAALLDTGH